MATRKRTTSESGAYMSQYDVEVEKKLTAIEARLAELETAVAGLKSAPAPAAGGSSDGRLDQLIAKLNNVKSVVEYFPKGEDGVRRIDV